jgi:hypothetical protein
MSFPRVQLRGISFNISNTFSSINSGYILFTNLSKYYTITLKNLIVYGAIQNSDMPSSNVLHNVITDASVITPDKYICNIVSLDINNNIVSSEKWDNNGIIPANTSLQIIPKKSSNDNINMVIFGTLLSFINIPTDSLFLELSYISDSTSDSKLYKTIQFTKIPKELTNLLLTYDYDMPVIKSQFINGRSLISMFPDHLILIDSRTTHVQDGIIKDINKYNMTKYPVNEDPNTAIFNYNQEMILSVPKKNLGITTQTTKAFNISNAWIIALENNSNEVITLTSAVFFGHINHNKELINLTNPSSYMSDHYVIQKDNIMPITIDNDIQFINNNFISDMTTVGNGVYEIYPGRSLYFIPVHTTQDSISYTTIRSALFTFLTIPSKLNISTINTWYGEYQVYTNNEITWNDNSLLYFFNSYNAPGLGKTMNNSFVHKPYYNYNEMFNNQIKSESFNPVAELTNRVSN